MLQPAFGGGVRFIFELIDQILVSQLIPFYTWMRQCITPSARKRIALVEVGGSEIKILAIDHQWLGFHQSPAVFNVTIF